MRLACNIYAHLKDTCLDNLGSANLLVAQVCLLFIDTISINF